MTDKDMAERTVFKAAFPSASLQLCLFHTLRSISREVTLEKMGIRVGQRDALLSVFNAMAVARSEQAFEDQCAALEGMNIPAALTYCIRNWLPIKLEWVQCFKSRCFTLGETTNNRLESLNGKIKSVCSRFFGCILCRLLLVAACVARWDGTHGHHPSHQHNIEQWIAYCLTGSCRTVPGTLCMHGIGRCMSP